MSDGCNATSGCVWNVDVCSPGTELVAWNLGVTEAYDSDVDLAAPLDMLATSLAS